MGLPRPGAHDKSTTNSRKYGLAYDFTTQEWCALAIYDPAAKQGIIFSIIHCKTSLHINFMSRITKCIMLYDP